MKWNLKFATLVISASLMVSTYPITAFAMEDAASAPVNAAKYQLTDQIKVEVKSILNERVAEGTRIGAVVRLYNQGTRVIRVPEYEVRVQTDDGVEYTLRPSSANVSAIQPKEQVELSYMITIDRGDMFKLSELTWDNVDEFQYPIVEETVLSIPISSYEWQGDSSVFTDPASAKKWGESFTIPVLSPSFEYTPVNVIKQNTPQGPASVVTLLVENKGEMKEAIPDFRMDGKTDRKIYNGKRIEQETIALEPGEKKNIHYAIQMENKAELKSLNVLTPESYVTANQTNISYNVGRLNIQLPNRSSSSRLIDQLEPYQFNTPIHFDPLNSLIQPEVDVSLVELHMHESEGDGYKTAIAKFKLNNHSDSPVPVPNFQAELASTDGYSYKGNRQNAAAETLVPNLSYIVSYSFNVPSTEKGDRLAMRILDGTTAAPYNIPIAEYQTKVQNDPIESELAFYPFIVKLQDWTIGAQILSGGSYSYKLKLELDIKRQENVVVDQNFSKMKVELVDSLGRVLGSETSSFTGANRLISGWQTINFTNLHTEQFEYPLTLNIYETIETPFGEAKRLVKTLKQ